MRVGQKWVTPNGQVYEILDVGDQVRVDIHHETGGMTPNTWTFSRQEFERMIKSFPLRLSSQL